MLPLNAKFCTARGLGIQKCQFLWWGPPNCHTDWPLAFLAFCHDSSPLLQIPENSEREDLFHSCSSFAQTQTKLMVCLCSSSNSMLEMQCSLCNHLTALECIEAFQLCGKIGSAQIDPEQMQAWIKSLIKQRGTVVERQMAQTHKHTTNTQATTQTHTRPMNQQMSTPESTHQLHERLSNCHWNAIVQMSDI